VARSSRPLKFARCGFEVADARYQSTSVKNQNVAETRIAMGLRTASSRSQASRSRTSLMRATRFRGGVALARWVAGSEGRTLQHRVIHHEFGGIVEHATACLSIRGLPCPLRRRFCRWSSSGMEKVDHAAKIPPQ